jgi:hypothetical protein
MKNTIERTVYSLCLEIDELKNEVEYWHSKYEEEKKANASMIDKALLDSRKDIVKAFVFVISVNDGNLVINKENRESLGEIWAS